MKRFLFSAAVMAMMNTVSMQSVMAQKLTPNNIDEIVSALTLDEKVHMIVGCGNGWGNPDVKFPGIAGWTYEAPRLGIHRLNGDEAAFGGPVFEGGASVFKLKMFKY